ncbi:MAG: hypothetical protein EOO87_17180, partial [Pedobacter sp.]
MEAILSNLIKATGWSILHSLWQGALIYSVIFVLFLFIKSNAKVRHDIAFGALTLIFFGFCANFVYFFELPSATKVTANATLDNLTAYYWLKVNGSLSFKTEGYFPLLVGTYLIGIIFQLTILLMGYAKLKQIKKASTIKIPEAWKTIFAMTVFQLKIKKPVSFYLSASVSVPLVIGFFKPVVLFPIALATQLDHKQVEAILIHELSHIRRNDYLLNLFKTLIETILFFNPFVWLTTKFINIEREHACDDLVVELTNTPLTYAHALLKLEILKEKSPALAMAATGSNQHLYQRIKRITAMKTNYINVKQQVIILALTIATVFSVAWINPTKESKKSVKPYSLEKLSVVENKPLNTHLISRADTDTVKRKHKKEYVIKTNGKTTVYQSLEEMPDTLRESIIKMEQKFNSKEWKDQIAKIELNAKDLQKKFNSPEWKDKMAKIELDSKEMEKKFNSPEWKDKMAKIEFNAKEIEKKFNSKEWNDQMTKIEFNAKEMEKKFNSPEWKDKMAKIEFNAKEMEKRFSSKEWKDQMAKMEFNAKEIEKKFNSKEWNDQMTKIEFNAKEMEKKFNSPEWKQKIEDYKKLHDSPEYKELQQKFEREVKELKKQKGIKDDKAVLLFDGGNLDKLFTPFATNLKTTLATTLPQQFKSLELNLKDSKLNLDDLKSLVEKS